MANNKCNDPNQQCIGVSGPQHSNTGSSIDNTHNNGCVELNGQSCPPINQDKTCNPFQLTKGKDSCFIDNVGNEALTIGGADINVYKLLGVHEQGKLVDVTGCGTPISNGDVVYYPAINAFTAYANTWRSVQKGNGVTASAYIGYDFGEIKVSDQSRRMYGDAPDAGIRKHIASFSIKQSANSINRVTRARVERSDDGQKWYGVAVVNLPDDDCLNVILFNDSVASRFWRIRPVDFNGSDNDYWEIQAIEMYHNYVATDQYNIQDKVFLENRDRDYSDDPLLLKGFYDLLDVQSELSRFGIELPSQSFYISINFSACVAILGRPIVIGDIIQLPSETQYNSQMQPILKWLEVTDVAWSTEGYTPGWQPTMLRIVAQPAFASQETQDIFGDLGEIPVDDLGLLDKGEGNNPNYQDYNDASQAGQAEAKDDVPQSGREVSSNIRMWTEQEQQSAKDQGLDNLQKIGQHNLALYGEDAMPPNNEPFSEGPELPTSASHGDYHRLTYEGLSKDVPARLYRYSSAKNRWIYLETDRRAQFDPNKPRLQEFLTSSTRKPHTDIVDDSGDC